MRAIIREIRKQPLHIRHMFMWTSVAITFSFMVVIGIQNAKKEFTALLNTPPEGSEPARNIAQSEPENEPSSPFQAIRNSVGNLQANISELLRGGSSSQERIPYTPEPIPPQALPVQ